MKNLLLVCFIAFGVYGCQNSCCDQSASSAVGELGNRLPVAVIEGIPESITCGDQMLADASKSRGGEGAIATYEWSIDGEVVDVNRVPTLILPCDDKAHKICLKVTDTGGKQAQTCTSVVVHTDSDNDNILIPIGQ